MENVSKQVVQIAEQATFTPTFVPGVDAALPACDLCGAYVARRETHERWHRQFTRTVDVPIEWARDE